MTLYTFVRMYALVLDAAAHLLDKGVEHAKAKGVPLGKIDLFSGGL